MEKYIPKSFRQIVAMVLCLAMLVPMIVEPVAASELTVPTEGASVDAQSSKTSYTVIAGSDFQNTSNDPIAGANVVTEFMNRFVNAGYTTLDGFLFAGDYIYSTTTNADNTKAGQAALKAAVWNVYSSRGLREDAMIWVQGNHDPDSTVNDGTLSASGAHDAEGYGVYVINEKDYMWYNNDEATIKKTAAALETYLDAKVAAKYTKPIFVVSHLPLHYSMRTANHGDAQYANYIFDVLNEAGADGLNIIFLYGHDHSNGWDDYLGGSAVYLAKGDSINIAQSSKTNFAAKKLNFTYMNAGYVAYYTTPTTGAETDLTMTVFKITDDEVTVARYSTSAVHDLKSAGVKNTNKGDTFEPDTRVISSPQTITLNKTFKATATSAETGASVSGMGITGMTVEKVEQDVPTGYSAYATYDITPTGFAGGTATVTIPVDSSFDASRSVMVIDHKTGDTQICQIVDGEVTFTTTHFSLYTVAQTEADTASGEGTLKRLVRANSIDELQTGVPYVISDYNDSWSHYMLTNTEASYTSSSGTFVGLKLAGEPDANTEHVWYLKKIDEKLYPVYGSADSEQYLLITSSGVSLGAYNADTAAYIEANPYSNYDLEDLGIKSNSGYLNRRGGGSNNVATYYDNYGSSYWNLDQVVTDEVALSINASSTTINVGGTSKLTPVVTVAGTTATDYTVIWAVEDSSVATVSSSGVVTPVKMGQTTVTVTLTKANGITLTEPIVAKIPITVAYVHKTADAVTAYTELGNVVIKTPAAPVAGIPYVLVENVSGAALTGNMMYTASDGYKGKNIEGLEIADDYLEREELPVWYYEKGDGEAAYLRFGSTSAANSYLICNSSSQVTLGAKSETYVFDRIVPYSDDGTYNLQMSATGNYLNQFGGSGYNVAGPYSSASTSRWKFYEVIKDVSLSASPSSDTVYPGDTATLTPTVMVNGRAVSGNTISWTSSNTAVATVSNGVVTAKKGGSTTITATLTAADGTSLGTSVSVEIPIQVIDVTESNGTVTSTVTVEKKMSPVAVLVAGTASGPYIITNKGTSVVLTGNMMTKDNPAYNGNGGKVGLELSKYNDFSELWYFDGKYLRYGSANGPYLTLANDQVYLSDSADNAADILTLNEDGLSYTITSEKVKKTYTHKYMNQYGGESYNVVYYWSQDGDENAGSAWYFNTITPERTATISLTPSPTTVYEGQNTVLTPAITLDGVNQTAYKLKWSSSDENVATVYQGKVTGTAAGNAKIRATVNSINGEKFQTEICVEASVTVIGIAEIKLTGNGSVAQRASAKADTGTKLYIKYTDGTEVYVPITVNMLTDSNGKRVSTYNAASYTGLTVNYGSHKVGGFNLTVVAPDKPDYPAYPAEGSVFVDKTGTGVDFQSSGVAQIELTAGGIPSKTGADVIIMLDTSSSMISNSLNGKTRLQVLTESLNNLLNQLQQKDASGQQMDIRVAVAEFNCYFDHEEDSNYYLDLNDRLVGGNIPSKSSNPHDPYVYTGSQKLDAGAFVDVKDMKLFTSTKEAGKINLQYQTGTNYDYAFDAIYQLGEAITDANSTGEPRDLFVIFMSDGSPFQFNYFGGNSSTTNWNQYLLGTASEDLLGSDNKDYYNKEGKHWMAEAIKGDPTEDYPVIRKNDERDADHDNWITLPGLGATMYSIGFCLAPDSKITVDAMDTVIRNIASDSKYYFRADTAADLSDAFNLITNEIFYAASNAYFIDEMGEDYDLLLGTHSYQDSNKTNQTVESAIEVRSYSTWTYQDVQNGLCDASLVGTRKTDSSGNYVYTLLERVTFNTAGTEAYSNKLSASGNILKDGVICANTFWYNTNKYVDETNTGAVAIDTNGDGTTDYTLPAETFYWKLGTVSNAQMTLSYYVYLEDCGVKSDDEPGVPAGIYDTNEHAEMYYVNYLGNGCVQSVETPRLPWQQATVGYGFYLVDSNGNPIVNQSTGETGSFERAVKITQPVYQEFLLNSDGADIVAEIISGGDVLPEGYKLFDEGAKYEVQLNSNGTGYYIIYTDKATGKQTTYVVGVTSTPVSNDPSKDYETNSNGIGQKVDTKSYTTANTVVWFGVVATVECVPDTVVIDFGLPVEIDVIANDIMMGDHGELKYIGKTDAFDEGYATAKAEAAKNGASLKFWAYLQTIKGDQTAAVNGETADGTYGVAKISNGKVRYTLNTSNGMQMKEEETFVYAVNYTGDVGTRGYYYSTVTVIPATSIYYEDSFVSYSVWNVSDDSPNEDADNQWTDTDPNAATGTQAEDRPGEQNLTSIDANNIYGYDGAYTNMTQYSMGSAKKVTVNKDLYAEAQFTFWGTGFDVVSLTSNTTGTILVDVYKADEFDQKQYGAPRVESHLVDTYYGYKYENGAWVVDSESTDTLYQVPVMKVDGLAYNKYTVVITASYRPALDHQNKGSYDFYLDAIRIYDPANDGAQNETIQNAYKDDNEGWPEYFELRNLIISKNDFDSRADGQGSGIVFIDNTVDKDNKFSYSISDYTNYGPNNELYLAPGQAVAFALAIPDNVAAIHLAMKTVGGTSSVSVYDAKDNDKTSVTPTTISTATDLYYDITSLNNKMVVIHNTGTDSAILSITNIKVTYKSAHTDGIEQGYFTTTTEVAEAAVASLMMMRPPVAPEETVPEETVPEETVPETTVPEETVPEETVPEAFEPERFQVSLSDDNVKVGSWVVVTVTTSADVDSITINGETITKYTANRRTGVRTWKVRITEDTVGEQPVTVVAYSADGAASEPVTQTVTVTEQYTSVNDWLKDLIIGFIGGWFGGWG